MNRRNFLHHVILLGMIPTSILKSFFENPQNKKNKPTKTTRIRIFQNNELIAIGNQCYIYENASISLHKSYHIINKSWSASQLKKFYFDLNRIDNLVAKIKITKCFQNIEPFKNYNFLINSGEVHLKGTGHIIHISQNYIEIKLNSKYENV